MLLKSTDRTFNFPTNHLAVPAPTVAGLYRYRWRAELFFKWIERHLRIKSFCGTSENAVKTRILVAVTVCVLAAVRRKRLGFSTELYTILHVSSLTPFENSSLTLFEKTPGFNLYSDTDYNLSNLESSNQSILSEQLLRSR